MLVTVIATVWTNNLAIGVILGVLVAMVAFANRVAHFVSVSREIVDSEGKPSARYTVDGELFFASCNDLHDEFEYAERPRSRRHRYVTQSHLWDASTIAASNVVTDKYEHYGKNVEIVGLNDASGVFHGRLSGGFRPRERLRSRKAEQRQGEAAVP